ncbi:putative amidase signature domain-containing protein [Septoria linicola]|nr:putative amidase signature domain-containing protein [Septoria linicola]
MTHIFPASEAVQASKLNGSEVVSLIKSGRLTCEAYVRALLARIDERDEAVKAWVSLDRDRVIRLAQELDRVPADQRGPLHGLPIGIKDVMLTRDMPTQYNSRLFESTSPSSMDAAPVAVLRAQGALIFGKTSTTEFASSKQGGWHQNLTRNAHAEDRTPGGSSSGSAAAVADFQVPIALGTQTGGSIVRPAAFNGCFGFKPTWGAISREGLGQWSPTNDTCGFFARSVQDLKMLMNAYHVVDDAPVKALSLSSAKVAFCKTHNWPGAGPGTIDAMHKAKTSLSAEGAHIEDLELPNDFSQIIHWHGIILSKEGQSSFLGPHLVDKTKMHDSVREHVENRKGYTRKQQLDAYDNCARLRPVWDAIASKYDVVVTPSVVDEAPLGLEHTGDMSFNSTWTVLQCPAIHVPAFTGQNGMPTGLTLVSSRFTDRQLLEVADVTGRVWQKSGNALTG